MLAIIGGSGLDQLANLKITGRIAANTPYGEPSSALTYGNIAGERVVFLARHGDAHTIPPHLINYRANLWALVHGARAERIVAVASVGGIRKDFGPGAVVVPHQIIDYTHSRQATYIDTNNCEVLHVDFTHPYDRELRKALLRAGNHAGTSIFDGAVYASTQGPRLETAAEIDRLERDGADIVGMTGMPEAVLARELGVPYAAVCVVANGAAGRAESRDGIVLADTEALLLQGMERVRKLLETICREGSSK